MYGNFQKTQTCFLQHIAVQQKRNDLTSDPDRRTELNLSVGQLDTLFQIGKDQWVDRCIGNAEKANIDGIAGQRTIPQRNIQCLFDIRWFYLSIGVYGEQINKQPNKQGYIKSLIRADMERGGEDATV